MCHRIVESMRLENGLLQNAGFHNERLLRTVKYYFKKTLPSQISDVESMLESAGIPADFRSGTVKCRLLYDFFDDDFSFRFQFIHYVKQDIKRLKLVLGCPDYSFKYTDRRALDVLKEQRGNCDDIIIVKNGFVTDSSSSNIVLLKNGRWFTPGTVLLMGTARAKLLAMGEITETVVPAADLKSYEAVKLINAMLPFEQQPLIPVHMIESL